MNAATLPVIAGIDGSTTAMTAAYWAVQEAAGRDAPLRLVYVTKTTHSAAEYAEDVRKGHACLHEARTAIEAMGTPVTIETAVVDGPPAAALVDASSQAQMVCVGSVGIGRYARSILGSVAAELAEKAACPVAVIRPDSDAGTHHDSGWIIVADNEKPDNHAVVEQAMREATIRQAPVLLLGTDGRPESHAALEREIGDWKSRYPDVRVYPIANRAEVTHFLKKHHEHVLLAVIGSSEAGEVADIVGHGHALFPHSASSALVVRPRCA
ncbi:UspA domain-containing protein [Mycolicibacterium aurum]|uniref:UspA domain-containing protein n=1 Tax=Mycolicibacterium aurum TaxID=1791 RepID=A0A448IVS2_MYCAU|nr:universal stress protein [Mycolicibacterium aurum]VEG56556.1 UspA domain-containing protein [Mycolicibacterium aurum]